MSFARPVHSTSQFDKTSLSKCVVVVVCVCVCDMFVRGMYH